MLPLTPAKHAAESLPGYVMRVAETNGLHKPNWLALQPEHRAWMKFAHRVAMDSGALTALEQMMGLSTGTLTREQWRDLDSAAGHYVGLWDEAIPADALMLAGAQVCPLCLDDAQPFLHADWDFSLVTVCTRHGCQLIAECPSCGVPLSWDRARMVVCGRCAADLRRARTVHCGPEDVVVADFAAAVARFKFAGKVESLEPPESFFELGRLLCLGRDEFLDGRQQRHFSRLPLKRRYESAQILGSCIVGRTVMGEHVHRQLMGHVSHICALLGESRARSRLFRLLGSNDFLNMPVRRYLAFAENDTEPMRASELFQGQPPRLFSSAMARDFVGCTKDEFELAIADGIVKRPSRGLAYDVDHLLDVQRRLRSLLSEKDIDDSFGVPGLCEWLLKLKILKSERRTNFPAAVFVENYDGILDRLVQASIQAEGVSVELVNLGDVLAVIDAETLAILIGQVLSRSVEAFRWKDPWGWRQMAIDVQSWNRLKPPECP